MDGGQQLAGILAAGPGGPLAAPLVGIAEAIQPAVALPGVRDDPRARPDVTGDEGMQRSSRRVSQDRHPAPADPLRLPHPGRDAGEHLLAPGPAAAQARLLAPR